MSNRNDNSGMHLTTVSKFVSKPGYYFAEVWDTGKPDFCIAAPERIKDRAHPLRTGQRVRRLVYEITSLIRAGITKVSAGFHTA